MSELIRRHHTRIHTPEGLTYLAQTVAAKMPDDDEWEAWLEFHPADGRGPVLRTERETSQSSRDAIDVWASGLESVYFEGAFARAHVIASRRH